MSGPASSCPAHKAWRRFSGTVTRANQVSAVGAAVVSLALGALGCQARRHAVSAGVPHPRQELIAEIKNFEKQLGFEETNNFSRHSGKTAADYRCYYTGKLELPDTYEKLRIKRGSKDGCQIDELRNDVFFYAPEAVASGNTPITGMLSEASPERIMVLVPHEDFHNDNQLRKLPTAMSEAASTLVAFLTASEFARDKFGAGSPEHGKLKPEAELFLRKAELVNAYHLEISTLYEDHRAKRVTRQEALQTKKKLFNELEEECRAIGPKPASFNPCPAVLNNAGLAFDRTYTKRYPLLYRAFNKQECGLAETIQALRELANDERVRQAQPDSIEGIVKTILAAE